MSCMSINLNVGLTLGPLLGGIVYDRVGWYAIFGVGLGVLFIDIFLRLAMIEKSVARKWKSPAVQATFHDGEMLDQNLSSEKSTGSPSRKLPAVIALLRSPRLLVALWLALIQASVISAFDTVLPLHLNQLFGWTSFQAGLYSYDYISPLGLGYLAVAIPPLLFTPIAGWMADVFTPKLPAMIGLTFIVPPLLLLRLPYGVGSPNTPQEVLICSLVTLMSSDLHVVGG